MKKPAPTKLSLPNRTLACPNAGGPFESILILKDTVVAASAKRLVTWSRKSGSLVTDRALPAEGSPTLSSTGDTLVLLRASKIPGDYANVSTWRVGADTFEPIGSDDVPGRPRAVCFSPDETHIAWSAVEAVRNGHHRLVCDLAVSRIARYPTFDFGPREPSADRLARESEAPLVKTGGVAISRDAFAVAEKGLVQVFDLPSMTPLWQDNLVGAESLRYGPDGTLYASTSKGLVAAYDASGVQRWKAGGGRDSIPWLVVGGGLVVAGGSNAVLDAETGNVRAWLNTSLSALAVAADGGEVGTAPVDRSSIVEEWSIPPSM